MMIALLAPTACQENRRAGPSGTDFEAERQALVERMKRRATRETKSGPSLVEALAAAGAPDGGFGAAPGDYSYDPTGKRDPFRSFHWEQVRANRPKGERGPLEQFDLSQLSVVAIIWSTNRARALVQDPSGRGYVVSVGDQIGKNDGRVIQIEDNLVLVKESYFNFLAEKSTRDVELRIRTSQGG